MSKVLIIAEAGVNHNGSLITAKELIDAAAEAGADIVKFQTFVAEHLVTSTAPKASYQLADNSVSQLEMLKKLELSRDDHFKLIDYCQSKNIRFLSTAFDETSIDFLSSLDLQLWKVPSGEITDLPYLKKVGSYNQRVLISTGMANMREIKAAIDVLVNAGTSKKNITVLHCNTEYPTPMVDVNLKAMQSIQTETGLDVGYSDHTLGIEISVAAVAMGAKVIEKHFTLSRSMPGPDHRASLEPGELKQMVTSIRHIEVALGNGIKTPSLSESKNIIIARKSVHLRMDLKAGTVIEEKHLIMKRPGDGISPMNLSTVLGKRVKTNLPMDHKLSLDELV